MKNIHKKWTLFGMASLACMVGIIDTLNKGTYAINEELKDNINVDEQLSLENEYNYTFSANLNVDNDIGSISNIVDGSLVIDLLNQVSVIDCEARIENVLGEVKNNDSILVTGDSLVIYNDDSIIKKYILSLRGDTNGDGEVDLIDLVRIRRKIVEESNDTMESDRASDLNSDGVIDSSDLVKMRKTIVGWYDNNEEK